ncbi:glutaminase A [Campylobacter sp. RM12640]|uniref:glutaminase A n=1 Tax=unclassified Campylobacter TaxID=2593542 RepID=UPI001BD9C678|nr:MULTISPECIES: glutaminase A [unclassified Campylobacter]MBZ7980822.1 glutaminase A [Campylobacter sp. RM12642]MBZ7982798.1 glutaminase A [Campylobacter sp. RM12640]MBZ7983316.1 glutaminase A [Campylobacter sp. RM12647]MBZ7990074.1 glutaminase A [Campylobacter sp. RM12635]MBZ7990777.1 glutaminase A [Campylobacter sp. RM9331]MBZ7992439.1 glutaminase A [Campylobacter sp. RM9333]MBZ8005607.1 glutaminase A [Campylobacter sp. RM9332]MBZ8006538.1 glutaminase A [Campylobacter sp. RM9334]
MQELLDRLVKDNIKYTKLGRLANYIPELSKAKLDALGVCVIDKDYNVFCSGDSELRFSIQSVSKIVTLMLALLDNDYEYVFSKVGVEPTGDAFNSIMKLETSNNKKPFNPMINAGAIAVASMIKGKNAEERFNRVLEFFRLITDDNEASLSTKIYESENKTGNKNRALAYFMKNDGIISDDVEVALEVYFKQCSILANTKSLAKLGLFLANDGLKDGKQIVSKKIARTIKSLMLTCGTYDLSGEIAVRVGLPCKSGVGGGMVSLVPREFGIGVYGPALDSKGNSIGGVRILEGLSKALDLSIF